MSETPNFRIRKRANPGHYMTGFELGLETAISSIRKMEIIAATDPDFAGDLGDGLRAGLKASREGVEKSLRSYKTTRALFEAHGVPPQPEN
jgi:hypothetical protein